MTPRLMAERERGRRTTGTVDDIPALFVGERELHRHVAPHLGRDRFRAAIKALEAQGFPKISPLFKGRYLPAVRAWLDDRHGVGTNGSLIEDGPEQFDAHAR